MSYETLLEKASWGHEPRRRNYLVKIGEDVFNLKLGDTAFAPRNIPHCFLTIGEGPHQMILTYQPAGKMEDFFYNRKNPAYTDGKTIEQQFKRT